MFYGQIKIANDTSFIGRYLAAKNIDGSIAANKRQILDDIDPDGKMQEEQVLMDEKNYKLQRGKAYDYMPKTLKRQSSGPVWGNALVGGLLGAGIGAFRGAARMPDEPGKGALIGTGIGGIAGGIAGAGSRLMHRYEANKITPEDIARMKEQQKDRSFLGEFIPGHDLYDAYKAGRK